jgi:hypothetical protein
MDYIEQHPGRSMLLELCIEHNNLALFYEIRPLIMAPQYL